MSVVDDDIGGPGFAELMAELALTFQDDRPGTASLVEQIVAGAVGVLPGVVAAAVEHRQGDRLTAPIVRGDDAVLRLMDAQNDTGEGTCLQAWTSWRQVVASDVLVDPRWPALAAALAARAVTARAVICTPMEVAGRRIAVLTLVSDQVDFGSPGEVAEVAALARVFAAHAAIAVAGQVRDADMAVALGSRDVIGQAKGILMERFKITAPAAFAMLVKASSQTNLKLGVVCERLSATGDLAGPPPKSEATGRPPVRGH